MLSIIPFLGKVSGCRGNKQRTDRGIGGLCCNGGIVHVLSVMLHRGGQ